MTETPTTTEAAAGGSCQKIALLAVIAACAILAVVFDLHTYLSFEALKTHRQSLLDWHAQNGVLAMAVFVAIYAIVVALSLPGAVWMTIAQIDRALASEVPQHVLDELTGLLDRLDGGDRGELIARA